MSFITQNKVRAGAYVTFKSSGLSGTNVSDRGISVLALELDFLPEKQMFKVDQYTDFFKEYGIYLNSEMLIPVREALKNAETIYIYRLNSGKKASVTVNNLKITSKFSGDYSNNLSVELINDDIYELRTYVNGEIFDSVYLENLDEISGNALVDFEISGEVLAFENTNLLGGATNIEALADYDGFFDALQTLDFDTFGILTDNNEVKNKALEFTKKMRDDENKKIQCVLSDLENSDYEGVVNVCNGVILEDLSVISKNIAVAYVAGALAGCQMNESLTYRTYLGAVDAYPRFTNSQTIDAINSGKFVFSHKRGMAVIEKDINSFVSFSPEKSSIFSKNRVIRVLDGIANDIKTIFEDYYLGKVSNDDSGRSLFSSECIRYLRNLEEIACIENFDALEDIKVLRGEELDSVVVSLNITPIDSIEKLYMTVYLV